MAAYENYFSGNMQDFAYSDEDLQKSLRLAKAAGA